MDRIDLHWRYDTNLSGEFHHLYAFKLAQACTAALGNTSDMKLKIIAIEGKGNLEKEVVWLEAVEACSLQYYMICDTTYTPEGNISNELRHTFWFPTRDIPKGDVIALWTKNGSGSKVANDRKTTTHHLYWKLGSTVWNKDGDCAVLFNLNTWNTTKAE